MTADNEYVIALLGQPNSGKSTLFNVLTGMHQHVGNWPGKTVEKKEGSFKHGGKKFIVADLPGTYSLYRIRQSGCGLHPGRQLPVKPKLIHACGFRGNHGSLLFAS